VVAPTQLSELIEKRIVQYLDSHDERPKSVRAAVSRFQFLPLYRGWVSTLGIRPDGSMVRWDHEDEPDVIKALDDPFWTRTALALGAKKFPELADLIPERPPHAVTCNVCGGTGVLEEMKDVVCECGSLGWKIPGERARESSWQRGR